MDEGNTLFKAEMCTGVVANETTGPTWASGGAGTRLLELIAEGASGACTVTVNGRTPAGTSVGPIPVEDTTAAVPAASVAAVAVAVGAPILRQIIPWYPGYTLTVTVTTPFVADGAGNIGLTATLYEQAI